MKSFNQVALPLIACSHCWKVIINESDCQLDFLINEFEGNSVKVLKSTITEMLKQNTCFNVWEKMRQKRAEDQKFIQHKKQHAWCVISEKGRTSN